MDTKKNITILTDEDKNKLLSKTPYVLPDNPSDKGYSSSQIKIKMYEGYLVLFQWLKRAISELSESIDFTNEEINILKEKVEHIVDDFNESILTPIVNRLDEKDNYLQTQIDDIKTSISKCVTIEEFETTLVEINNNFSTLLSNETKERQSNDVALNTFINNVQSNFNQEILNIKNGITTVKKSACDQNGNVIDTTYIKKSEKGIANGVVPLNENCIVPSSYMPSYVDDVLEYDSYTNFPMQGESGKIYVSKDTNLTYRWTGTQYTEISSSLALGETESTAYAGNKGKANRDDIDKLKSDILTKYTKPETGIPETDLSSDVRQKLNSGSNIIDITSYLTFTSADEGTMSNEGYEIILNNASNNKNILYRVSSSPQAYMFFKVEMIADSTILLSTAISEFVDFKILVSKEGEVNKFSMVSSASISVNDNYDGTITIFDRDTTQGGTTYKKEKVDELLLNKPIEQIEATSLNDALATITNSIKGNNDYASNGYRQKIYVFKNNSISESYYIFPLHYGINISRDFDQYFLVVEGVMTANAEFNYYRCTIPISSSATADNVSKIGTLKDDFTNVVNKTSETTEDLPNRLKITIPIKYRASNLFDFEEDIFHKVYYDCLIIESTPLTLDFYNEITANSGTVRIVLNHPVKNRFKNIGIPSQISRKGKLGFYHTNNYEGVEAIEHLQSILDNETIIVEPNDLVGKNGKWIIRKIIPLRDILNIVLPDIYKPISYGNTIETSGMDRTFVGPILSYRQQFDAVSKQLVNLPIVSSLRYGWRRGAINRQIFYPINQLNTNENIPVEGRFLIHKGEYAIRARLVNAGQGGYLFSWNPSGTLPYSKKKPRWSFNRCAVGFSLCKLNHPTASEYAVDEPIFAKKYPLANKKLVLKSTPYVSPGSSVDYQTYCKTEINLKDNK